MMKLKIQWKEIKPGVWRTETVDPRDGKTYYSYPVPTAFAVRLGMKSEDKGDE